MTTIERLRELLDDYEEAKRYSSECDSRAHIHAWQALAYESTAKLHALLEVCEAAKVIQKKGAAHGPFDEDLETGFSAIDDALAKLESIK